MMRLFKITLITLVVYLASIPLVSCASKSDEAELLENQVVTVQRGDLTVDITAVGNLALSHTDELAFEMSGTVEEVLVEEGDTVEEGQVLAKLDTSEWEEHLATLEDLLTAAKRQVIAEERDLLQAEINLKNAEIALEETQDVYEEWPDIRAAGISISSAKSFLSYAERNLENASTGSEIEYWTDIVDGAEDTLDVAEERLEDMQEARDPEEVAIKKLQVELAQWRLEDAEIAIEDARKDVDDAQEELDEAKSDSPEITASFDGFIIKVNVEGGDEILKGTVAVTIADPNEFEADILISEMDILQVELGREAWVQVDAMQGISLPAEVTHISPTAIIQSGVVNYEVKVEIQSREAIQQERQEVMQDITAGELPERLKQAIEAGQITQEQAEEMIKQMQQGQEAQPGQMPTMLHEDFQIREGLTVAVSILVEERSDVLLVPNAAITPQRGQAYVQVVTPGGTIEERAIQTGISNWQYTEVTDGLSEGEQVVIPETAATPETSQQGARPRGGMLGFGGPH